ncbi:DUF998 domain-containing protein [Phytohabitans houttuyneae]|uniref:DUF998 domain-containing protein n=1 Tax=Phytohabitans houttuyneae TaxID=1076126 RepID=UPI001566D106|nr:DUF998 domain-containing protein [Phytohabitans houttuyneae]
MGGVNIAGLLLTGAAAAALVRPVRVATPSRWPAVMVAVAATGLVLAAAFVSDAPPGTRYAEEATWHGQLHDLGGGLTFLGLFGTCLATRRLATPPWGVVFAVIVALGFVTASAMAAASFAVNGPALPSGIAERVALLAGLAWLAFLAHRLSKGVDR